MILVIRAKAETRSAHPTSGGIDAEAWGWDRRGGMQLGAGRGVPRV